MEPGHLATRFAQVLGLSPKRMVRLVRFDHAAALLSRPATEGLAGVAAAAGYYDQSHFTNEVRAFTGLTPTQLVAGRLPDDGGVFDTPAHRHQPCSVSSKTHGRRGA